MASSSPIGTGSGSLAHSRWATANSHRAKYRSSSKSAISMRGRYRMVVTDEPAEDRSQSWEAWTPAGGGSRSRRPLTGTDWSASARRGAGRRLVRRERRGGVHRGVDVPPGHRRLQGGAGRSGRPPRRGRRPPDRRAARHRPPRHPRSAADAALGVPRPAPRRPRHGRAAAIRPPPGRPAGARGDPAGAPQRARSLVLTTAYADRRWMPIDQEVAPVSGDVLEALAEARRQGRSVVMATTVRTEGDPPSAPGNRALFGPDGALLAGTIGCNGLDRRGGADGHELLAAGDRSSIRRYTSFEGEPGEGVVEVFLEAFGARPRLVVGSAGPVADALATIGEVVGMAVRAETPG